jgi:hypothetical protein
MSLNISDTQRVTIWSVEDKGTHSLVRMSSSRKDKKTGEYRNSNWSFVRFVGEAHKKASELKKQDRIVIKAVIQSEDYMKDGVKVYPEHPQITVFNWERYVPDNDTSGEKSMDKPPVVESSNDEFPF